MPNKVYFPHSDQFDQMNEHLKAIAAAVGSQVDLSNWTGIRKAVLSGIAKDIMPVGTLLTVNHSVYGNKPWAVLGHDHLPNPNNPGGHTMLIGAVPVLGTLQFDAPEAIYYAESQLAAGTYHFTTDGYDKWAAGTYQFTLTQAVPAGGQIVLNGYYAYQGAFTNAKINTYASRTTTTPIESNVAIIAGSAGTNLGTTGAGNLNHIHRISYGSNNYKESAMRQNLNSASPAGSVWTPQTKFDRPPSWASNTAGFMNGLDDDFIAAVCETTVPCGSNNVYEAPDSTVTKGGIYSVNDKFFLLSNREIGFTSDIDDGSTLLPYYDGATNADRIKYNASGVAATWWERAPNSGHAGSVRLVHTDGTLNSGSAHSANGLAPACNIG